jgi:hypothetical protein
MRIRCAIVCFAFWTIVNGSAHGQIMLSQNVGPNAPFQSRLTLQGSGRNAAFSVHRDALNRPCLEIEAASRRHVINPDVFDHVVSVYNNCLMPIKLRVCYYKSDHCIDMQVSAKQRKDGILGIFPNMQYFRYSFREQF